jgi:hypothetical protein
MTASEQSAESPHVLSRWLGVVGLFIAPTTVITGLCFYFGYVSTRAFLAYFGVDSDAIGYTTGDYVLQSVSVLYPQIVGLLLGWLALLWAAAVARRLAAHDFAPRRKRFVAYTIIGIGVLIALRGVVGLRWPTEAIGGQALTPITLATGTVVIVGGYWLWITARSEEVRRRATTAERASLALAAAVVLLALFWVANIFATAYGMNKAELTAATLWSKETGVTLETSQPLTAPKNMIVERTVSSGGSETPSYRYQCFRGLAVHGDRWVLVPARWTPENGYAVIVDVGPKDRISTTRLRGIAETPAAAWGGTWQCPEVGPLS